MRFLTKYKPTVFFAFFFFTGFSVFAQDSSEAISLTGYIETYYCYDLGNPSGHLRPACFSSYNRHNEININLGFIKYSYSNKNIRANVALMAGTYTQYNLAAEPDVLQHVLEGNVGIKLTEKYNLWVDLGVFPSHIGFESAIGMESWNVTRSILAENSPYYESGVKLGYSPEHNKYFFAVLILNGWQRIQRQEGNHTPAFGTQATFSPNEKIKLNWSTFIGNEFPDSVSRWRYFNNFYSIMQFSKKFGCIAGFDIGFEQKEHASSVFATWYSPVVILQFKFNTKNSLAVRGEYYSDRENSIITAPQGFETAGFSLNYDRIPNKKTQIRIEARMLNSTKKIFILNKKLSQQNYFITTTFSFAF